MRKLRPVLLLSFWLGLGLFLIGQVITFVPGAEASWFFVSGLLCLAGLFVRSKAYAVVAIVLVLASAGFAVSGYQRGVGYQHALAEESAE